MEVATYKHIKSNLSFSCSKVMKWLRTPKDIWADLTKEFNFTIDCCASDQNHLLPRYYTIDNDCLTKDWSKEVAEFLIKKNKYETSTEFLSGLLMCADNEDEDGLYDFMQENGGEVVFESPNNEINSDIGIFVIKQIGEAQSTENASIKTDGSSLFINDEKIELSQLSSGHFDIYQDPILVYAN